MTCQGNHRWEQVAQDGVSHYRCSNCCVLGREDGSTPVRVVTIKCSKGCGQEAMYKTPTPSNTYLCKQDFLDRLGKLHPRYRRG